MNNPEFQSILRCERCNKPFDKQPSLKRHEYYCRSRRVDSVSRSRSCISCAERKARCDNRQPKCSRCTNRAIECLYPAKRPHEIRPKNRHIKTTPTEWPTTAALIATDSTSVEKHHEPSNDDDIMFNTTLLLPEPELANLEEQYIDWVNPAIDITEFVDPQTKDGSGQYFSSEATPFVPHSTPSSNQSVQQAISSPSISIPPVPTYAVRSLARRSKEKNGAQRTANLILHILKSYPLMMLNRNAGPPFIHSHMISSEADIDDMESLNNCISLLHMISSRVQGSRKLFWRNVRLECERICAEVCQRLKLNKWELLAAMQAVFIYLLIRLDEGETDHNNFDSLLIKTVVVLSQRLAYSQAIYATNPAPHDKDLEMSWYDWIFEESCRRICVVYQVVNMLVYFEPAMMCDLHTMELILAPLPAKKLLWEASDEIKWKAENEKEPEFQTVFGMAVNGDLMKLDVEHPYCQDSMLLFKSLKAKTRSTASWEEWCSGMDGLGGVVMLAASLVG